MKQEEALRLSTDEVWQLVRRVQLGDTDAFDPIFRRYQQQILNYLYYRTKNHAVAEDLTSDVFLRALKHADTFQDRGVDFGAVLYRIARNALRDFIGSAAYQRTVAVDTWWESDPSNDETDTEALQATVKDSVWREMLEKLTARERKCIVLRFRDELNTKEVSSAMGIPVGAVRVLQHKALRKLRCSSLARQLRSFY